MADLTSVSTGAGGLGTPSARWALLTVWALGVVSDTLRGAVAPPFGSELLALPFGLVSATVLTTRGDDALSSRRAIVVGGAAVISAAGALASGAELGHTWSFNLAAYVVALLLPRGNVRAGLVSGAAIGVLGLAWGIASRASLAQFVDLLALPMLALVVGAVWRGLLGRIVRRELTYNREAERAAMAAQVAEASGVAIRTELAEIATDVGDLLDIIGEGRPLDDELVDAITVAEADVRDRIRSPNLRHSALRAGIDRARRRGVQVQLLGSSSQPSALTDLLAERLVETLDAVDAGTVTVRAIPPGRQGAVSLLRAGEETSERLIFAADGRLLSRH